MKRDTSPLELGEREARVAAQVREFYRRAAVLAASLGEEAGVHPTDVRALRALDEARERPLTVGELGARLGLSSAAMTGLVDRLEHAGLGRRVPDPGDRRRVLVELTDTARSFGRRQLAPVAAAVERALAASDEHELEAVERFLAVLLAPHPESPQV